MAVVLLLFPPVEAICDTFDADTYDAVNSPGPGEVPWLMLLTAVALTLVLLATFAVVLRRWVRPPQVSGRPVSMTVATLLLLGPVVLAALTLGLVFQSAIAGYDDCAGAVGATPLNATLLGASLVFMAPAAWWAAGADAERP